MSLIIGLLQTDQSLTRSFEVDESIELMINMPPAQYFSSLAWYHNGNELTTDNRVSISNSGTTLTISNMVGSDAGKYEVKIKSTGHDTNGICDDNILPMLENTARHAPVVFVLQESNVPTYNPGDVILDCSLPAPHSALLRTLAFSSTYQVNVPAVMDVTNIYNNLFKDGIGVYRNKTFNSTWSYDSITTQFLMIPYSTGDDIAGYYVQEAYASYVSFKQLICPGFYNYIQLHIGYLPLFSQHFNITSKSKLIVTYCKTLFT